MWRGGRKCGWASELTRDDDARHGRLNPVVRTEVDEILGLYIWFWDSIDQGRFGYHFHGILVETFAEVPAVCVRSRPFVSVQGTTSSGPEGAVGAVGSTVGHGGMDARGGSTSAVVYRWPLPSLFYDEPDLGSTKVYWVIR